MSQRLSDMIFLNTHTIRTLQCPKLCKVQTLQLTNKVILSLNYIVILCLLTDGLKRLSCVLFIKRHVVISRLGVTIFLESCVTFGNRKSTDTWIIRTKK